MLCKAAAMGDHDMYVQISNTEDGGRLKRLGRMISNFNQLLWDKIVCSVAYNVLLAKFSQDQIAKRKLISTGQAILVEASPTDHIWGAGLAMNHEDIRTPQKWKGTNILGWALM